MADNEHLIDKDRSLLYRIRSAKSGFRIAHPVGMPGSTSNKITPVEGPPLEMTDTIPIKKTEWENPETTHRSPDAHFDEDDIHSRTASWIRHNINSRYCAKFVPKLGKLSANAACYCGHKFSEHKRRAQLAYTEEEKEWKLTQDTEPRSTDAYGEMEFTAYGSRLSKFIRCDHNTDMDTMLELMIDHWNLDKPNLLISVTGGAKNFTMRTRLKEVFRRGLMKAAESTGAWITTGGMHAGVMKHVGEAVRDHMVAHGQKNKVICIGIGTWGCVNNKEVLIDKRGSWPAKYRTKESKVRRQSPLDPNHSHFILVDDGTQHKFGVEIALRARLEKKISQLRTGDGKDLGVSVPVVQVVLEGGPGTLETVKSAIQNGTPAVIVEGSGRAADVLAFAYSQSSEEEVEVTDRFGKKVKRVVAISDEGLWTAVKQKILDEWGTNTDIDIRVMWVKECLEKRDHMTVFRLDGADSAKDIDLAILQALLKVNKGNPIEQLKLALAWNRIDVARSEIFTDDEKWTSEALDDVMYTAILDNKVEFVKLFLENGLSLRDFLSMKKLLRLYNDIPANCLLGQLLNKIKSRRRKFFNFEDLGNLIANLTGDFYRPLYLRDHRYKNIDADELLSTKGFTYNNNDDDDDDDDGGLALTTTDETNGGMKLYKDEQSGEVVSLPDFDDPARELFLWAILMEDMEMATLLMTEGKESIAAALTAEMILKEMLKETDDSELEKHIVHMIEYFEQLSVGILSECYAADEKKAQLLLVREMPGYGCATALLLAVEADNKNFIAHAACQSLLNNIWRGRMSPEVGTFRMWLCIFCPLLIFPMIKYRQDDRMQLISDSDRSEHREVEKVKEKEKKPIKENGKTQERPKLNRHATTSFNIKVPEEVKNHDAPKKTGPSVLQRISWFYNAPVITFIHNCIFYFGFLILYSIILLTNFHPRPISPWEYVLIIWVFTLFAEEIRQVLSDESSQVRLKFRSYISDVWNILDMVTIITFIVGVILRLIPQDDCKDCFEAARIILALNLMTFFFRILHIFSVHKELGPKLVMIGRMIVDLCYFVIILMVFIAAYGLAAQAILYPNSELGIGLVQDILRKAYWQIYGELFLEEIEGQTECTFDPVLYGNNTLPRCPENTWVVPILLGVYILITNVLMLNLLIAMFSYTFERVQSQTDQYWFFQRYFLIKEYYLRPPLAPPLIIINHVYIIFRGLIRCCCKNCGKEDDAFLKQIKYSHLKSGSDMGLEFSDGEIKQLILWEKMNAEDYERKNQVEQQQSLENRVKETNERVDQIQHKVDEMLEASFMTQTANSQNTPKLPPVLDDRLVYLEEQLKRTGKALDWIIENMGGKGGKGPDLPNIDDMREKAKQRQKEEMDKKKEEIKQMLKRQLELHVKSRTTRYPCSESDKFVYRFTVPDAKVPWDMTWPEYEPVSYTDKVILDQPSFADDNLMDLPAEQRSTIQFNKLDQDLNGLHVDRRSHLGEYEVKNGIPLNPKGRTGLIGRGILGRWGPNHAGDPVVTRWKRNESGEILSDGGKKVLEFVSIQRADNKEWAIPGALIMPGQAVFECLKAEFKEEALNLDDVEQEEQMNKLKSLWNKGEEVYRGYADDPRNTDNAWIETIAINYHDESGSSLKNLKLQAGSDADMVRWQKINAKQNLYGGHLGTLQKVAEKHNAAF